ncbi:MAG TPA: prepilin-type N-terminal cleavage/methylation domain-containing protein [Pantanalinema sp.]
MSRRNNQSGFTLIEVSLAIVIGVIVLAGAITLYNQSKISAGNSKAQEKVLALATMAEEISANRGGSYPDAAGLQTAWEARRDDAKSSPWGGAITPSVASGSWASSLGYTSTASAGVIFYSTGAGTMSFNDIGSVASPSFANFAIGIVPPSGGGVGFIQGGK